MISIVSTINYVGRVLAIVEIEKENSEYIRTLMYRSTGSNVDGGEGYWFPFLGIDGPGLLKQLSAFDDFYNGRINKDLIYAYNNKIDRFDYILRRRDGHSDINTRYKAYNIDKIPFDIKEVANALKEIYTPKKYIPLLVFENIANIRDIEFMNTLFYKGLTGKFTLE